MKKVVFIISVSPSDAVRSHSFMYQDAQLQLTLNSSDSSSLITYLTAPHLGAGLLDLRACIEDIGLGILFIGGNSCSIIYSS